MNEDPTADSVSNNETPPNETPAAESPAPAATTADSPASTPPQAWTPPATGKAAPPCACNKKLPAIAIAAAIAIAVIAAFFGCGKSPAKKSLQQAKQFVENVENGRIDRIFAQLPGSAQEDVREIVRLAAEGLGEKFFDEFTGAAEEGARFIKKNRKELWEMLSADFSPSDKERLKEDDLLLFSDFLDSLSSKATYSKLSRGKIEGVLEIGALHKWLKRFVEEEGLGGNHVESIEIEDASEKEMPVLLVTLSRMAYKWDDDDMEMKKTRKTETSAIGFVEEDGVWVPAWGAEASDKNERRRAEKNRKEWLVNLWKSTCHDLKRSISQSRKNREEIDDLTFTLSQLRKDFKRLNNQKPQKGKDFEEACKGIEKDLDELASDWEKLMRTLDW